MTKKTRNRSVFQTTAINATVLLHRYRWFHWNNLKLFKLLLYITSGGNHTVHTMIVGNNHWYIKKGLPLPVMIRCQMPVVNCVLPNDKYFHVYQEISPELDLPLMPSYFAPTLQPLSVAGV